MSEVSESPPEWFKKALEEARTQDAWDHWCKEPLRFLAKLAARHGYALVPEEPTEKMADAAFRYRHKMNDNDKDETCYNAVRAMIAAGRVK